MEYNLQKILSHFVMYLNQLYFNLKRRKNIDSERKISYGLGLEELMLLKYLYFPKQSADLMQSLPNTHDIFHQTRAVLKLIWNHKRPQIARAIFFFNSVCLLACFWLLWVFVAIHRLFWLQCAGFPLWWLFFCGAWALGTWAQ